MPVDISAVPAIAKLPPLAALADFSFPDPVVESMREGA